MGKVEAVSFLGLAGGEDAGKVLRELFTEEGAAALVEGWRDGERPASFGMDRDRAVALVRGRAAMGLVLAGRAEDVARVEKAYRAEDAECRKKQASTKLYNELVSAVAARDLIAAKGLEGIWSWRGP